LAHDVPLHLYELGDLDDFFFADCSYFGHESEAAVALLYAGSAPATLLALGRTATRGLRDLVVAIEPELPRRVYAHLAPGLSEELRAHFTVEHRGRHKKLVLADASRASRVDTRCTSSVMPSDLPTVRAFYERAYPGSWFVPRMLDTGYYFGVRDGASWGSMAGVHVLSLSERVAALGNVATLPSHRGRGLAKAVCARLLAELTDVVDHVGLNVGADNQPALRCYRSLGFVEVGEYEEVVLERLESAPRP
jgi:ribosomal protein S18 acetylase RimI-like enzyme